MNEQAFKENIKTLAQLVGLEEREAASLLDSKIAVFANESDRLSCELADFLVLLLRRTVTGVYRNPAASDDFDVSVKIGGIAREQRADVFVAISDTCLIIGRDELEASGGSAGSSPIWALTGACYSAAQVMKFLVGEALPVPADGSLTVRAADIFGNSFDAGEPFDIGTTWLAGAGAIGNAFVYALSLLNPYGVLHIADPDRVDGGNLNRCICFCDDDLLHNKAERLAEWAAPRMPSVKLIPHSKVLAKVPECTDGAWLQRMVVAVDSRLARRNLQNELPGEVFDASTTDIREFVLHFNRQPLKGSACLSCIYFNDAAEDAHSIHVAEALGVDIKDIRQQFVSASAAAKIAAKYAYVTVEEIKGLAYDTLFKQMCGEGKLVASEDRQVFAPFAFVSVLAGVFLAIEFKRRLTNPAGENTYNYWKVSPWSAPVSRGKRMRRARPGCQHCSDPVLGKLGPALWDETNRISAQTFSRSVPIMREVRGVSASRMTEVHPEDLK
ncbi:MAG TPA: ThiF family adenylyltransferase [Pyrinomonadaceae bacterium]|nr:ThiF family adenylyltransferase [Pyrinomonadaceae bacterium]